jgi:hypothetical protein
MNEPKEKLISVVAVRIAPRKSRKEPEALWRHKDHGPNCTCMVCPYCGAAEIKDCSLPTEQWYWQIRAYKVDNYSHCTVCGKWFP